MKLAKSLQTPLKRWLEKLLAMTAISSVLLSLTACGSSGDAALQSWMAEQRSQTKPRVERLPEPTQFLPQAYSQDGMLEPFSSQKLTQALKP